MIRAIYYFADTGRAYKVLTAPDLNGFPEADAGSLALLMPDSVQLPGYVQGTTYTPIGDPPTDHHRFNWITREWEDTRTLQDFKDAKWAAIKEAREGADTWELTDEESTAVNAYARSLRQQLYNATTPEQVAAIQWAPL